MKTIAILLTIFSVLSASLLLVGCGSSGDTGSAASAPSAVTKPMTPESAAMTAKHYNKEETDEPRTK